MGEKKNTEKKIEEMTLREKLVAIQTELKVPKGQQNTFGNYKFRSCEDILEKLKPYEQKYKIGVILSDEIILIGNNEPTILEEEYWDDESKRVLTKKSIFNGQRFYIKSTATLFDVDTDETIINCAYAREEEIKKGMDSSQITGAASSYARKYALNGLLGLDDVKDPDTNEFSKATRKENDKAITKEEAENYIFQTGKHKNEKLIDVYNEDYDYLEWLIDNKKANPTLRKCIETLEQFNEKVIDRLELLKEMKDLELKTNSSHEKILETYGVKSDTEMSSEQIQDAIKTLKKYLPEAEKEMTPYDF